MKFYTNPIPNLPHILSHTNPGDKFYLRDDSDGFGPYPTQGTPPNEAAILAAEPAALAALQKERLSDYAEQRAARRSMDIKHPVSGASIGDSTWALERIFRRRQKVHGLVIKAIRHGNAGQVAAGQEVKTAHENIVEALDDITGDIDAGTVTTAAQVDALFDAVVLN